MGVGCSGLTSEPPISIAAVNGRVTNILTQAPLTSGNVRITPNGAPPVDVPIGNTGFYALGGLPLGPARIQVTIAGYRDYSANVNLNAGSNTHDIQLTPNP